MSRQLIIIFIIIYFSAPSFAQVKLHSNSNFHIEKIKIGTNSDCNTVFCITQDKFGYMWYGTRAGLYQFDGYEFKAIVNPKSLQTNAIVKCLYADKNGVIWYTTESDGLCCIRSNHKLETFSNPVLAKGALSRNAILSFCPDSRGILWLSTTAGLTAFNLKTKEFTNFTNTLESEPVKANYIKSIVEDKHGNLWLSSLLGLIEAKVIINGKCPTLTFKKINEKKEYKQAKELVTANDQIVLLSNYSLLLNQAGDLISFNLQSEKETIVPFKLTKKKQCLTKICDGNFWTFTNDGFIRLLNSELKEISNLDLSTQLKTANVLTIYEDAEHVLWIGTQNEGLIKLNPYLLQFTNYNKTNGQTSSQSVRTFIKDNQNQLWIGGYPGFDCLNLKNKQLTTLNGCKSQAGFQGFENIYTIKSDKEQKNILWIGSEGNGFAKFNTQTKEIKVYTNYTLANDPLHEELKVYAIYPESKNKIWLGTKIGLAFFDTQKEEVNFVSRKGVNNPLPAGKISFIYGDDNGILWIGHDILGLIKYNALNNSYLTYSYHANNPQSICSNKITCILKDKIGKIWISTDGGVCKFDPKTEIFNRIGLKDGLIDEMVYALVLDDEQNIWMSTNNGLICYNDNKKSFFNFTVADGIQDNEFNTSAFYKDDMGIIYFGGINGITSFFPPYLKNKPKTPKIAITAIKNSKGGDLLESNQNNSSVLGSKPIERKVNLNYKNNSIQIQFSVFDYSDIQRNRFAYRMLGIDSNWIYTKTPNVNFNTLEPGEYIFEVIGSNHHGVWNMEGDRICIQVKPPFWLSRLFFILIAIVVNSLIIIFVRWREKKMKLVKLQLERKIEERVYQINQHQHEISNQNSELKLQEQKQEILTTQLKATLNNLLHHMVLFSPNGEILLGDFKSFELFESIFQQKVKKGDLILSILPFYMKRVFAAKIKSLKNGNQQWFEYNFKIENKNCWFEIELSPIFKNNELDLEYVAFSCLEITSRKKLENELRQNKEQIELINDNIPLHITYINTDLEFLYANKSCADWFGIQEIEMRGKALIDVFSEESFSKIIHYFDKVLSGQRISFLYSSENAKGKSFDFQVLLVPHMDDSSRVKAFFGIYLDISEQRKSDIALKESEERYRKLFESVPLCISVSTLEGQILTTNSTFLKTFEYSETELNSINIEQIYAEPKNRVEVIKTLLEQKNISNMEMVMVNKSKDQFYCDITMNLIQIKKRNLILSTIKDISDKKKAEIAIAESEEKFSKAFKFSPDCIILTKSDDYSFVDANNAFIRTFGYSRSTILSQTIDDLGLWVINEDRLFFNTRLKNKGECLDFETILRARDSRQIACFISGGQIRLKGEKNILIIIHDMTENKRMQQEIVNAKVLAENANKAKSIFLSNMSHEIRTPMNSILGYGELLLERPISDEERAFVKGILASGHGLLDLINDILDISKIEAGRMSINLEPICIRDMLLEIKQMFLQKTKQKQLDFNIVVDPIVPNTLILDEVRVRQILYNLISNSIKFTDLGFINITFSVENFNLNGNQIDLLIRVDDSGIGIAENQLELIFQPFRQQVQQNSRKYGGTGLGLTITKKIVEALNGEIKVESEVGKGSSFIVKINEIDIARDLKRITNPPQALVKYNFNKAKILIIEDIQSNREVLAGYLAPYNVWIEEAENGELGVQKALEWLPDLIFMDMQMPVLNGMQACHILKTNPETVHIPILAITAFAIKDEAIKIRSITDGFLSKPIMREVLLKEMLRFLNSTQIIETVSVLEIQHEFSKNTIDTIQSQLLPLLNDIKKTYEISSISVFAKKVMSIANQLDELQLSLYGENLLKLLSHLQFDQIRSEIDNFEPLFLKNIKN